LTQEHALELFNYEPDSGLLVWKIAHGIHGRTPAGTVAGTRGQRGVLIVRVGGKNYLVHRVIWLIVKGAWPKKGIDHKDLDPGNNKWDNLRECTQSQNSTNCRAKRQNKFGIKGAYWSERDKSWSSKITVKRQLINLGTFKTAEDAHAAYMRAALKYFGEFARAA